MIDPPPDANRSPLVLAARWLVGIVRGSADDLASNLPWLRDSLGKRLGWAAAATMGIVSLVHARGFFHDDAYITFRYVTRLLGGKGLTWTAGPPVEGYTHPLWLLQLAVFGGLNVELEAASKLLGLAYLSGIFVLWWRVGAWPLPLLAFAALPGTALWTLGGLEMMGYLFWLQLGAVGTLQLAGVRLAPERAGEAPGEPPSVRLALGAGLALAAAALHRPDALAFCVLAPLAVLLGPHPRRAFPLGFASLTPVAGYLAFRYVYFGSLQAAPAAAKIVGVPLWMRLESFQHYLVDQGPLVLPAALAAATALLWRPRRATLAVFLVTLAAVLPAVLGGGDHMLGGRLMLPFAALVGLAAGLRWAEARPPHAVSFLVVAAAVYHGSHLLSDPPGRDPAAVWGRIMGEFLHEQLPPGALVATATAGSTPFFSRHVDYIDTLGLNDQHIAERPVDQWVSEWQQMPGHWKGDGAYVLSRAPDVIIRGGAAGNSDIVFLTDFELDRMPEFARDYEQYSFNVSTRHLLDLGPGWPMKLRTSGKARLFAWVRVDSDKVDDLRAAGEPWPEIVFEPPTLLDPESRCLTRKTGAARDDEELRTVEFRWRAPRGHGEMFLDLKEAGSVLASSYPVTDASTLALTIPAGAYEWRVSAKLDRWRPSEWSPLTVHACPPREPPPPPAASVAAPLWAFVGRADALAWILGPRIDGAAGGW